VGGFWGRRRRCVLYCTVDGGGCLFDTVLKGGEEMENARCCESVIIVDTPTPAQLRRKTIDFFLWMGWLFARVSR